MKIETKQFKTRVTSEYLVDMLRNYCAEYNQKFMAKKLGVSQSFISDVLKGNRSIGENTALKMGFRPVLLWEPIWEPIEEAQAERDRRNSNAK